jgi:hypothetical protein
MNEHTIDRDIKVLLQNFFEAGDNVSKKVSYFSINKEAKKLEKERGELKKKLSDINSKISDIYKNNLKVRCIGSLDTHRTGCGKLIKAKTIDLVECYKYDRFDDMTYLWGYYFICPFCGIKNRILNSAKDERYFLIQYFDSFKSVKKVE